MGIHPLDRHIFHDDKFLSAYVTDRSAEPANEEGDPEREPRSNDDVKHIIQNHNQEQVVRVLPDFPPQSTFHLSVRFYPKAGARKKK
ncbi:hypothetical protein LSAT2_031334 [Lamellibrachia satsuma]|nr:hypothetical protein LSAT2_031334 [Lamellibrachia satsuma]